MLHVNSRRRSSNSGLFLLLQNKKLANCSWKGEEVPCEDVFEVSPTDRGMCCAFNMKGAEEIFRESRYSKKTERT